MPTERGRDRPDKKGRCRGSRIPAPSLAPSDQPPSGSETAFLYVRPFGRSSTTAVDEGHESGTSPYPASRRNRRYGPGKGCHQQGGPSFRGEGKVAFRDDGGARLRWYLDKGTLLRVD